MAHKIRVLITLLFTVSLLLLPDGGKVIAEHPDDFYTEMESYDIGLPPQAPVIIGPADGTNSTDHTPNFDWEDVSGATSYIIQVSPDADFTRKPINHTVTNSFFAPGVSMINQLYYWRVNAIVDSALVGWSEVRTITISGAPGNAAPTAVSPADSATTSDTTPTFDWTDVGTAARYTIHISKTDGFGLWIVNQTSTESTWTPGKDFNPGTYWWRVQAEGGGDSSWFTVKRSFTITSTPTP